jgi:catechol 2,3-dioxygenase-like lactoylglutathione lyase family enzyme
MTDQSGWPGAIAAITLFVEDLGEAKTFYERVFRLPIHWEDDNSAVFLFGGTMINLLQVEQAPGLIEPAAVAPPEAGARVQFTLGVEDVDATCEQLRALGVQLLNGPVDRPWGPRTASFRDPGGHIWEIAS